MKKNSRKRRLLERKRHMKDSVKKGKTMSNTIPMQMYILNEEIHTEYAEDSKKNRQEIADLLKRELGDSFTEFNYKSDQRVVTGCFETINREKVYIIVANLTFMGGTDGQHPKDLKRIQYNAMWRNFYNEYSNQGKVLWLGLYSYKDINIWAMFEPKTYVDKHAGSEMISKGGFKAQYSCHIFLNDLYQGYVNEFYSKTDRNNNTVGAVKPGCLAAFFNGTGKPENPIVNVVEHINNDSVEWHTWITAERAIRYMKELQEVTGFKQWKQNLWNGWYIEAKYSEYLHEHPSKYLDYVATSNNENIKEEYKDSGLDLAFPEETHHFVGDLKAVCEGTGNTLLNDEKKVKKALEKYKKIWFIIYIHDKKPGKTNNHEMVRWRNEFIRDQGEWDYKEHDGKFEPLSAKNTPHSVSYSEMVVIELNEITKERYFTVGKQWGLNSDGKERNDKFKISKRMLKEITDDSFVIYRYRPEDAIC